MLIHGVRGLIHSKYSIGKLRKTWKQHGNAKETKSTKISIIMVLVDKAVYCVHVP